MPVLTPQQTKLYQRLRLLLWVGMVTGGTLFSLSILFPRITQSFDFDNPGASRNQIVDPRGPQGESRTNGKLAGSESLIGNTSLLGDFSSVTASFTLENDSDFPEYATATVRRGYRAAFLPIGDPVTESPSATIFLIDGNYYRFENDTLTPFISEAAYRSRYPAGQPLARADASIFAEHPRAKEPLGFRVGSLLSFADGVFVVTSDTEIRPIGSAEIFLALGYRFDDVLPVSEEELGIYKRGRIVLLNTPHADGTLFRDQDTGEVFVVESGKRRLVTDTGYREFLVAQQMPIETRASDAGRSVSCTLESGFFPRTYRCTAPLTELNANLGSDYELTLQGTGTDFEMETLSLAFDTHVTVENARTLLAKVKQRILVRFGLAS